MMGFVNMNVKSDKQVDEVVITLNKREAEILALLLGAISVNEASRILNYYNGRTGYPKKANSEERGFFSTFFFALIENGGFNWPSN